ncbi:MAG TPA: lysylphosphatidylglycerol synthase transmembrane domain-containing protein [Bacteroidales bacterium]|nr:lysylphosphatidylglycerol synthase transmembrane domain-containing protein [Bacteroidales bacterium]
MSKTKRFLLIFLQYAIFLGLGIILLYFAFRSIDFQVLVDNLKHTRYDLVVLSLFFGFGGMLARAYRWQLMIEPLGYKPRFANTYHALIIGYTANYAFPRIGEVTRCGVLGRTEKRPADALLGTVIAERIFDVLVLFLLTILVILLKIKEFGGFFSQKVFIPLGKKFGWLFDFSIYTWILAGLAVAAGFFLVYAFRNQIRKITLVGKIKKIAKGVFIGFKSILYLKRKQAFFASTLAIWVFFLLMTYICLKAMQPTAHLTMVDALFLLVVGSYGFAAPVQAGIGAYHGMIALALSIYAISWSDGLAYALLSHGAQAVSIIFMGLISMLLLFLKKRQTR